MSEQDVQDETAVVETVLDAAAGTGGADIELLPENLIIDPQIEALRIWTGQTKQETEIADLAKSIEEEGQSDSVIAWDSPEGLVVVSGSRRVKAIQLLRAKGVEITVRVRVDPAIPDRMTALRLAMHANSQRANFTAIEEARQVKLLRGLDMDFAGKAGTKRIASFLNKDEATITQLERLLTLPEDVQARVQDGEMKPSAALELVTTPAEKIPEVLKKAKEIAEKRAAKKKVPPTAAQKATVQAAKDARKKAAASATTGCSMCGAKAGQPHHQDPEHLKRVVIITDGLCQLCKEGQPEVAAVASSDAEPIRMTGRDVRQAQSEVEGGTTKTKAWKASDVQDFFAALKIPNGYPSVMTKLAQQMVERLSGRINDKQLEAAWDDMADYVIDNDWIPATQHEGAKTLDLVDTAAAHPSAKPAGKPAKPASKKKTPANRAPTPAKHKSTPKPTAKKVPTAKPPSKKKSVSKSAKK